MDWDLMIHRENETCARADLKAHGAVDFRPLTVPGFTCRLPDDTPVDVLVFDEPWVDTALNDTAPEQSGDPVLDLPWLILLKLRASRVQDLADISRMLGNASAEMAERCREVVSAWDPGSLEDFDSLLSLGRLEMGE